MGYGQELLRDVGHRAGSLREGGAGRLPAFGAEAPPGCEFRRQGRGGQVQGDQRGYQVLSNAESRKKYDRFGDNWRHADEARTGAGRGESSFTWFNRARTRRPTSTASAGFGGFGDVFGDLFGGQRAHGPEEMFARPQFDAPATITLEEAFAGTKRTVQSPPDPMTGTPGKRLEVSIPAGVESGSRVHVSANGGPSAGPGS